MKRPLELEHRGARIGRYRGHILSAIHRQIAKHPDHTRGRVLRNILGHINARSNKKRNLLVRGHVCRSTIYVWAKRHREHGIEGLAPRFAGYDGIPRISQIEAHYLIKPLNDGIRIGIAILIVKYLLQDKGISLQHSPATLRRWAERYLEDQRKNRKR